MLSLEEAVRFARYSGLKIEIVAVLDRPSPSTRDWIRSYDFDSVFDEHTITEVDNGALGPSRNDGIALAKGEYIGTVDADDLVSYNMFVELYQAARSHGTRSIAVPQYWRGFGDEHHLMEYFGTDQVSKLAFFQYHPYVSRVFGPRELFEQVRFSDIRLASGYHFEDWHHNVEAVVAGYEFVVAPATIMFYRQRRGSLMRQANTATFAGIAESRYFDPEVFTQLCAADFRRFSRGELPVMPHADVRLGFAEDPLCLELTSAAQNIDPSISLGNAATMYSGSNLDGDLEPGTAYYRICQELLLAENRSFTDVVLLPFLTKGGADKFIIDVLDGLGELDPNRRFLVLVGQKFAKHEWLDRLPENSVFIDLYEYARLCYDIPEAIEHITLRVIQSVAPEAVLHLKSSEYAVGFFRRFHPMLKRNRTVFYRFCDIRTFEGGLPFTLGHEFDFLSEHADALDLVITDNAATAAFDCARIDVLRDRYHALYAHHPVPTEQPLAERPKPRRRLLWASRMDRQKRPELLLKIAPLLKKRLPDVRIDIYGSAVLDMFDPARFDSHANLAYKGGYDGFAALPCDAFDAMVYTSHYDGLPNVVLEAMATGLPVIAPDIDGISEAVADGETGFLIDNLPDEEALADAYVAAVERLYAAETDAAMLGRTGRERIAARHGRAAYLERIAEIFGLPSGLSEVAEPDLETVE